MISDENGTMGDRVLGGDEFEHGSSRSRRSLGGLAESLNFKSFGNQALALRDKIQDNPKTAAGIALALAGGVWAISRSVSASRRRHQLVSRLLAGAGLWRALAPLLRSVRKKAPKVGHAGAKRMSGAATALRDNAGPLLNKLIPLAVSRFARRGRFSF